MFSFQHSQKNQQDFEQLAELLLICSMVFIKLKLDVGKTHSALHLPLKPDTGFKKTRK